jgi:hypothetical protein
MMCYRGHIITIVHAGVLCLASPSSIVRRLLPHDAFVNLIH